MSTQNDPTSAELNSLEITIPLSAFDPSSGRTWVITRPWDKLCDKYLTPGNLLSAEFDLYAARRTSVDPDWRNRLEGADLMATGLMNSRMSSGDVDAVLTNRGRIEAALQAIPTDLHLADADLASEPLRTHLTNLIAAFRCSRVGVAKVMKTLCQKRPRLLPMLDSLVRCALYNEDAEGLSDDPTEFAQDAVVEIELFRRVLLWGSSSAVDNYPRLVHLAGALTERLTSGDKRLTDVVTPVRLLDDLIWFEWGGHQHYGWWENKVARRIEK